MRRLAIPVAALALLAGCDEEPGSRQDEPSAPKSGLRSPEGRMIRDWLGALKRGDYGHAASFFAPGALIDQGRPFRLPDRAAARLFNAGLPCSAELVALTDEGDTVLASFRLSAGPGGPCEGRVRVRYTIEHGRFTEWRQLAQPPPAEGPVV